MNSFVSFTTLVALLGCIGLSQAGRPVSTSVIDKLRQVEPQYKALQDYVINEVSSTKFAVASRTDVFYQAMFNAKEASLSAAIVQEDDMYYQLSKQPATVEKSCLDLVRTIVENNMFVAGVGYTNCINTVDEQLQAEVNKIYEVLQIDETNLFGLSLLDVFKTENIIAGPEAILSKLDSKTAEINNISTEFLSLLNSSVNDFQNKLNSLDGSYRGCLSTNEGILKMTFDSSRTQLLQICMGTLVQ